LLRATRRSGQFSIAPARTFGSRWSFAYRETPTLLGGPTGCMPRASLLGVCKTPWSRWICGPSGFHLPRNPGAIEQPRCIPAHPLCGCVGISLARNSALVAWARFRDVSEPAHPGKGDVVSGSLATSARAKRRLSKKMAVLRRQRGNFPQALRIWPTVFLIWPP